MFELLDHDYDGWIPPDDEMWSDRDELAAAVAQSPGTGLLLHLLDVNPAALTADEAITYAEQFDRLAAHVAGLQVQARADVEARLVAIGEAEDAQRAQDLARANADRAAAGQPPLRDGCGFVTPHMLASGELAAALRLPPRSMDVQLEHARDLAGPMRPLRDALLDGLISPRHGDLIARELGRLPAAADPALVDDFTEQCERILAVVLPYATTHTAVQSGKRTRTLVLATYPKGADERRRETAEREHGVWLQPIGDASCQLTAVMPLAHGYAAMQAVDALAKDSRFETADGCVTIGQRRVASLVTLTLGDPGSAAVVSGPVAEAKVKVSVNVIVPLEALLTDDPAAQGGSVAGEQVTADTIRDLLVDADPASTLRRLVTDAAGCIIDAGRTRYAISDIQRRLIILRDGTCRFPGCSRAAEYCEIDHATAYSKGGRTDRCNLGPLCKHHHQLKTFGGWEIIASYANGACTWRSPLGRIYHHEPPGLIPAPPPTGPPPF